MKYMIFSVMLIALVIGCARDNIKEAKEKAAAKTTERFEVVNSQSIDWSIVRIIKDKETGQKYLWAVGSGVCPLVEKEER